jgi:hypothetical protein
MLSSLYLPVRWLQFVICSLDAGRFIVFIELYRVLLSLIDRLGYLGSPTSAEEKAAIDLVLTSDRRFASGGRL